VSEVLKNEMISNVCAHRWSDALCGRDTLSAGATLRVLLAGVSDRTAHEWGVVAEIVPNGKTLARAHELASLYLKAPEVTRRNTRAHFIQPLKQRIVREIGDGLALERPWPRILSSRCKPRLSQSLVTANLI